MMNTATNLKRTSHTTIRMVSDPSVLLVAGIEFDSLVNDLNFKMVQEMASRYPSGRYKDVTFTFGKMNNGQTGYVMAGVHQGKGQKGLFSTLKLTNEAQVIEGRDADSELILALVMLVEDRSDFLRFDVFCDAPPLLVDRALELARIIKPALPCPNWHPKLKISLEISRPDHLDFSA